MIGRRRPPEREDRGDDAWFEVIRAAEDAAEGHAGDGTRTFATRTGARLGVGGLLAAFLAGGVLGLGTSDRLAAASAPSASPAQTADASGSLPPTSPSPDPSATPPRPWLTPSPRPSPSVAPLPAGPWPGSINSLMVLVPSSFARVADVLPPLAPSHRWLVRLVMASRDDFDPLFHRLADGLSNLGFGDVTLTTGQNLADYRLVGPGVWGAASSDELTLDVWIDELAFRSYGFAPVSGADWYGGLETSGWRCGMQEDTTPGMVALGAAISAPDRGYALASCGRIIDESTTADPILHILASDVGRNGLGVAYDLIRALETSGVRARLATTADGFRIDADLDTSARDLVSIALTSRWAPEINQEQWTLVARIPFDALDASGRFKPSR